MHMQPIEYFSIAQRMSGVRIKGQLEIVPGENVGGKALANHEY